MKRLLPLLCWAVLLVISLTRCDHRVRYQKIPSAVQQYFAKLPPWQKPKKVQVDQQHQKVYWLTQHGEIHAISADGTHVELVNKGIGATLGITYIGDFVLDSQGNTIYFTDLLDLSSGLSAIKKSDLQGEKIQTLATFPQEMPYAVFWDNVAQQLYYLTEREKQHDYGLQLLGESIPLSTADHKIEDISVWLGKELPATQRIHQLIADQSE